MHDQMSGSSQDTCSENAGASRIKKQMSKGLTLCTGPGGRVSSN